MTQQVDEGQSWSVAGVVVIVNAMVLGGSVSRPSPRSRSLASLCFSSSTSSAGSPVTLGKNLNLGS